VKPRSLTRYAPITPTSLLRRNFQVNPTTTGGSTIGSITRVLIILLPLKLSLKIKAKAKPKAMESAIEAPA